MIMFAPDRPRKFIFRFVLLAATVTLTLLLDQSGAMAMTEAQFKTRTCSGDYKKYAILPNWACGDFATRQQLCDAIHNGPLAGVQGFDENFCQNAVEAILTVEHGMKWAYRSGGTIGQYPLTSLFPPGTELHVYEYGGTYVSRVCGNYSQPGIFNESELTCESIACSCSNPSGTFCVTLRDKDTQSLLAGKTIHFDFISGAPGLPDTLPSAVTDLAGHACINLGDLRSLPAGTHTIRAEYSGDANFTISFADCTVTAPRETAITCDVPANVECNQPVSLCAILKDELGVPVAGATLLFHVDGPALSGITGGDGRACVTWTPTSAGHKTVQIAYAGGDCICASSASCSFRVFATVTVCKFNDGNMNGQQDGTEPALQGWPVRLVGTTDTGTPVGPIDDVTGPDGCCKFSNLDAGTYTLSEIGPGVTWQRVEQLCNGQRSCYLRASVLGKRWQFTGSRLDGAPYPFDTCASGPDPAVQVRITCHNDIQFGNVCLGKVQVLKYYDRNMSGSRQTSAELFTDTNGNGKWDPAELYDDINNNGKWDPAEAFTDKNGNGRYDGGEPFVDKDGNNCWDNAEPLRDTNNNNIQDPAEPFTDSFPNGTWDDAEEGLADWPVALCGTDVRGKCIGPIEGITGPDGTVILNDIPPGNYKTYEDVEWCGSKVDYCGAQNPILPALDKRKTTDINGRRWLATTPIFQAFTYLECAPTPTYEFGNVCLASISGELSRQDCPNDPLTPLNGWQVCLTHAGVEQTATFMSLPLTATNPDCAALNGNCTTTAADGSFRFGELVPGVYLARETSRTGFAPVGDVVELCVPFRIRCEDIEKNLRVRSTTAVCPVYQAAPGSSEGLQPCLGYLTSDADPITAAPGILSFDPGSKWENFVRAYRACTPYCLKDVQLDKVRAGATACADVFAPAHFNQHGSANVRTWWPLMYEPQGTTWTISILYTTFNPVKLPGETSPSVVHQDKWKWIVDVNLDTLDRLLDVYHQLPFGRSQVPLISDDEGYIALKNGIIAARNAADEGAMWTALSEFEMTAADMCIGAPPDRPGVGGFASGYGIANTQENPACCKILADIDYLIVQFASQ